MLHKKAEITYPTQWHYKVVCTDEEQFKSAITTILEKEHSLEYSKESKEGKYKSFLLITEVANEEERNHIFRTIKSLEVVAFVL